MNIKDFIKKLLGIEEVNSALAANTKMQASMADTMAKMSQVLATLQLKQTTEAPKTEAPTENPQTESVKDQIIAEQKRQIEILQSQNEKDAIKNLLIRIGVGDNEVEKNKRGRPSMDVTKICITLDADLVAVSQIRRQGGKFNLSECINRGLRIIFREECPELLRQVYETNEELARAALQRE